MTNRSTHTSNEPAHFAGDGNAGYPGPLTSRAPEPLSSSSPETLSPRARFLSFVRDHRSSRPVCSPFLPHPTVIRNTLAHLGLPVGEDDVHNEIVLSRHLDYEPMFMADLTGQIFAWTPDPERSNDEYEVSVIQTRRGEWLKKSRPGHEHWNDDAGCPVLTEADHDMLVCVCEEIGDREEQIRAFYRNWRLAVGDDAVIVLGHPHPSWLGYQINPSNIFYHWTDFRETFVRSMEAVFETSLFVMSIATEEGIDFMSDSSYGLEMTSPELFREMDLPYIQRFAAWTHERDGLFWYHNCGHTRQLILDGSFNSMGADVIETIAPPPEGDNASLAESRAGVAETICTKGNFSLGVLRDGTPGQIISQARKMVETVRGERHIWSTADAVLEGTPPENFITFVETVKHAVG